MREATVDVFPEKHPDATLDYGVDFEFECAHQWDAWTDYSLGVRIRVFNRGGGSGYEFEATQGGRSGGRRPIFIPNATIRDGSVIWTPQSISGSSLLRSIVGTPTWTADTGLTVGTPSLIGLKAIANLGGGIAGEDYSIEIKATTTDGLVLTKQCVLPVRIPVRKCG